MGNKCKHIKVNGTKCNAYALKEKEYCFIHDPASKEKREIMRQEGGSKRVILHNSVIRVKKGKIKNVMRFLAKTITEVREGTINPQIANSIFIGCNSLIKCFEIYDLEIKLQKIEKFIDNREL